MYEVSGSDLRVDEVALGAAVRRLAPLAGEIDAALADVEAILDDLRRDCSGHHTGADFVTAQSGFARMTEAKLRDLRGVLVAFTGNITRTPAEFGDVEATTTAGFRNGQC